MSGSDKNLAQTNVVSIGSADVALILQNLHFLRDQVVAAWQERAVMLTKDEQDVLYREIKLTCEFLGDLTRSHRSRTD
jgi:hypothetical protein